MSLWAWSSFCMLSIISSPNQSQRSPNFFRIPTNHSYSRKGIVTLSIWKRNPALWEARSWEKPTFFFLLLTPYNNKILQKGEILFVDGHKGLYLKLFQQVPSTTNQFRACSSQEKVDEALLPGIKSPTSLFWAATSSLILPTNRKP